MKNQNTRLSRITLLLICILTVIYVVGKSFFPTENEKQNSTVSSSNSYLTKSDAATQETYITFNKEYARAGEPLQICIVNPGNKKGWSFTWKVGDNQKSATDSSYTPEDTDIEKFITATASCGSETYEASIYFSRLPVIYLDTKASIGDVYTDGQMKIQGNDSFTSENSELYNGNISIKLRGNSTKDLPKHPYKIKLENKADLLGMGASKHWVLLANAIDHSLIRNKLVYDFSGDLGQDFAAQSDHVVLILNGSYTGVYQLCEQIRISKERVDIFNWENLAEDAAKLIAENAGLDKSFSDELEDAMISDLSWMSAPYHFTYKNKSYTITDYVDIPEITGGFLLEMDFYHAFSHDPGSLQTNFLQPFYFNTPETGGTNKELSNYARNYIQAFEYALHSDDFVYHDNAPHYEAQAGRYDWDNGWNYITKAVNFSAPSFEGKHYSQLFDLDSLINNFLICEFTVNWDSMKNSLFVSKDLDETARLSPNWDYDWAFGNINMFQIYTYFTDIWQTTDEYFTNEQCYQAIQWNRFLIKDPYFLFKVYEKYQEIRPTLLEDIIKDEGLLDTYYEYLKEAGKANDEKWQSTYQAYGGETFDNAYNSLEDFIEERINWLDEQFTSFDTFVDSLGYYEASSELAAEKAEYQTDGSVIIHVKTTNSSAASVQLQMNGTHFYDVPLVNGMADITIPQQDLTEKGHNIVQARLKDSKKEIIIKTVNEQNKDNETPISCYKVF